MLKMPACGLPDFMQRLSPKWNQILRDRPYYVARQSLTGSYDGRRVASIMWNFKSLSGKVRDASECAGRNVAGVDSAGRVWCRDSTRFHAFDARTTRAADFQNSQARLAVRGREAYQLPKQLRKSSTAGGADHSRSAVLARNVRKKGESEFHHRNRRTRAQPPDTRKRGNGRRPASSADGADLAVPSGDVQRSSHGDRGESRVFQPLAPPQAVQFRQVM
jgi:hypothetical protein